MVPVPHHSPHIYAGDQPQMNGRYEVTVKHLKAAIRRTLHGAGAPFEHWPLATRFINEKLRQKQVGKEQRTPPFLSKVLVRKRYWRMKELEPFQEQVLYLCPSWVHHGHRVERPDGTQTLTKIRPDGNPNSYKDGHAWPVRTSHPGGLGRCTEPQ